jgi:hypothetical protein
MALRLIGFNAPQGQRLRFARPVPLWPAFRTETLVTRLDPSSRGEFVPVTQDWSDYWRPVYPLRNPRIDSALRQLHEAWRNYVASGFDAGIRRQYCLRYFSLLDLMLSAAKVSAPLGSWHRALQTVLGFECFGITDGPVGGGVVAAGTTTMRNPCYLLARLRWPDVPDDTRFLPVLSTSETAGALFEHYRQYWTTGEEQMGMLVHLSNSTAQRPRTVKIASELANALGSAGDPYVLPRAERLWNHVVRPLLQGLRPNSSVRLPIELVDIGAGSGALLATVCQHLVNWARQKGLSPVLRIWLVELSPTDPTCVFRAAGLRGHIESLKTVRHDYRAWLGVPRPLPPPTGLRIAAASKVFDMSSRSSTCAFRTDVLPSDVVEPELLREGGYLPTSCLASGGRGPEALLVSSSRIPIEEGHVYFQPSLSEYYRALSLVSGPALSPEPEEGTVWLPVRALDPQSLVALDGASVFLRLLEQSDYVIVEDADLRPEDLVQHLTHLSLQTVAALDMTKTLRLTANYAYVLWSRGRPVPNLEGERLW